MNGLLLEMRGVSKRFPGVKALDDVQLRVRPGSVHALMGENGAGKSTLMKCLFGIYLKDSGSIFLDGREVDFLNPKQALDNGVAMVHQELNQVMHRNVMDNIWMGRYPERWGVIDEKAMYAATRRIFDELSIPVDPKARIGTLSVSERQMVEIAKAVSYGAKALVLDEPTSSLTEKEVEHLFRIIHKLRGDGCGIIYISHKMSEILRIADDITVMRDGKWVGTHPASELDMDRIIRLMVGRDLNNYFPPKTNTPGETILEVRNFTALSQPSFRDVSFTLRKGEILGIAGLMGSKRTEVVESLFGMREVGSGEILLRGGRIANTDSRRAIRNGFALITEERRHNGIFAQLSVLFNATIANIDSYTNRFGVINGKKYVEDAGWVVDALKVKTPSLAARMANLSGGNQQKVILGRWMLTNPDIFLMDEPTRGIDVGAKYEIYQLLLNLANGGKAVVMISSEMPELLGMCDRILVMSAGRVAGVVESAETSQEEILALSARYI